MSPAMLKPPPFLSYCYSVAPFLYRNPTTRRLFCCHYSPPLSPGFPSPRSSSSFTHTTCKMDSESYTFGPYKINPKEVFYSTQFSYAMVNLRPLVPAQKIGRQLESYHKASSLTFAIQDGPQAGQTVPHVHIHILPRKGGDFEKNDEIYDAIDVKEKELKQKLDLDKERTDRCMEEMTEEADQYKKLFM